MDALLPAAIKLAAVVLLTLVGAFFVASEYALVTLRRTRVDQLIASGNRSANMLHETLNDIGTLLAATQLGVTMVSLALGAFAEPAVSTLLGPALELLPSAISRATLHTVSVILAFAAITAFDIIVGELAPKSIGLRYNERVALFTIGPIRVFIWVFRPFIRLLEVGGAAVARLVGAGEAAAGETPHSPEELKMLVAASTRAGVLEPHEEEMLVRVFEFSRLTAHQIMVPRTEMVAVPVDISLRQLLAVTARERHTRLPVYEDSLDNVVGILYLRDFLLRREQLESEAFDVRRLMREPLSVPETIRGDDLLRMMRQRRVQIAIVIDEFGGTAGLVTLEDLLERIVGEVHDEFEAPVNEIETLPDGSALIDGLTLIDDVNNRFDLQLDDANYDTIGGYVFGELGRRPAIGDEVPAGDRTLRVETLDGLRIARVRLSPAPAPTASPSP